MEPYVRRTGILAVMDRVDVDTDQIIPKQFLKRIERTGYEDALFFDWRWKPDGSENPDFELNLPRYRNSTVLVAGRNFGCGSSREHAVWALHDFGFRAIVAPSFADIFYGNCTKTGVLPVVLPQEEVHALMEADTAAIDLERQVVAFKGREVPFEINSDIRHRLLNGLDDIALTLQRADDIDRFEQERVPAGSTTTSLG